MGEEVVEEEGWGVAAVASVDIFRFSCLVVKLWLR
jgi:hypothetical protein